MSHSNRTVWLVAGILSILMAQSFFGQDQNDKKGVRLPIEDTQDDGGVRYEPVKLNTATVQFFERKKEIHSHSEIMDYSLNRNADGHLNSFKLLLRPEPLRLKAAPPGSQAGALPLTKWTIYWDLDGDSVFDAMAKCGPGRDEDYILFENKWVPASNSDGPKAARWGDKPKADDGQVKYFFEDGVWKR